MRSLMAPFASSKPVSPARRRARRAAGRRAWLALALALPALAIAGGATWLWRSGAVASAAQSAARDMAEFGARFGLAITEVSLEGRENADRGDILAALQIERGLALFAFDPHEAKRRLEALPWVAHAAVERRAPAAIHVQIVERKPFALWQQDRRLAVVDRAGVVLAERNLERFGDLLLLVGHDAPRRASELLEIIATEPELARRVTAAVRVGGRRWNVLLDDAIEVKLPEEEVVAAWNRLARLERANGLLARDISAIDLRLSDRLMVTLSNELPVKPRPDKRAGKDFET